MEAIGLESLLAPISPEAFLKDYWPGKPLFVPADPGKLTRLFDIPQLHSLPSLIAARRLKVRACLPDYDDEYSSIFVEAEDAEKVYRNNMTLVFDQMQTQCPPLAEALVRIRTELGILNPYDAEDLTRARSLVYATPAGGHTRLHFDANANFVVQISGTKRWMLAPNTSVENPTERYTSCTGEMAAALETQCHAQLLDELPPDCLEKVMEPGAVLFVPRGWWHETTTEDDSISVNFTFSQPTWADLFTRSLYDELLQSSEWRALADGRNDETIAHLDALVSKLKGELRPR